jgi:DNA helicase II / ATP-dependent DNA helicase PcrA
MSLISKNLSLVAAAGARKTEQIIESALSETDQRVLITTYTNENQKHIINRIEQKNGVIPPNIKVMGWFSFLITQCAKPYQKAITNDIFVIKGLNFKGQRNRYTGKTDLAYFLDKNNDMYRDGVSDFIVCLNEKTRGAVVSRLERVFSHIYIDEVQDLVGYDLDIIDLLFRSSIKIILVGDPRQHTLSTNIGPRNKKYQGSGLVDWFNERSKICTLETRNTNYRCNQNICDFADAIYPAMPKSNSVGVSCTEHDGVFFVKWDDVMSYMKEYNPVVLRNSKIVDTQGLPAMNIGVAKGRTFDRVLIFPTKPMLTYLEDKDEKKLKAPERLYVAVTRARYSVAFVVPDKFIK